MRLNTFYQTIRLHFLWPNQIAQCGVRRSIYKYNKHKAWDTLANKWLVSVSFCSVSVSAKTFNFSASPKESYWKLLMFWMLFEFWLNVFILFKISRYVSYHEPSSVMFGIKLWAECIITPILYTLQIRTHTYIHTYTYLSICLQIHTHINIHTYIYMIIQSWTTVNRDK